MQAENQELLRAAQQATRDRKVMKVSSSEVAEESSEVHQPTSGLGRF